MKTGRPVILRHCRYCGAAVTGFEYWHGHEGCARTGLRRYTGPGRRKSKPPGKEITFSWTKEEIAEKIRALGPTGVTGLMAKLGWR
jgi:hypothetical protein